MNVVIIGATGLVGTKMIEILEERKFPIDRLIPVTSDKSIGKSVKFKGNNIKIVTSQQALGMKPDIALFAVDASVSKNLAPEFVEIGCKVIDNSSCWRMDPAIKLVIPEINADIITEHDMIIANPNCSTIQMLLPLAPLHKGYNIKRIVVSTYQSVTGTGYKALEQMSAERSNAKWGEYEAAYPYPIDQNIIPHIDEFLDNGYTKEEMKMINETHKILGDYNIAVSPTTVRVPVKGGHSESINVEFEKPFEIKDIFKIISETKGVVLQDNPAGKIYPMPLYASGKDDVFVGRIRRDLSLKSGINMWCVADNLRKGAATNAIQIAEYLLTKNLLK
ncbi:MAG: aspartate-semialdehyde dehydrogenase [Bacteroidales bacterium]|jgi:aspartate-semialdehyde dehydrogenase